MVFISAMIVQRSSAHAAIAALPRGRREGGGGRAALHAEHQEFPEVDHFVLNEAELTLPLFLHDLEAGAPSASTRRRSTRTSADPGAAVGVARYEALRLA